LRERAVLLGGGQAKGANDDLLDVLEAAYRAAWDGLGVDRAGGA